MDEWQKLFIFLTLPILWKKNVGWRKQTITPPFFVYCGTFQNLFMRKSEPGPAIFCRFRSIRSHFRPFSLLIPGLLLFLPLFTSPGRLCAQSPSHEGVTRVVWQPSIQLDSAWAGQNRVLRCQTCSYSDAQPGEPLIKGRIQGTFELSLVEPVSESLPAPDAEAVAAFELPEQFTIGQQYTIERGTAYTHYTIRALRRRGDGAVERLSRFRIQQKPATPPISTPTERSVGSFASQSRLAQGRWFRLGIPATGIYRITPEFLSQLTGEPSGNIDPRTIKIYGDGGGMLPESNAQFRHDDLVETPVFAQGEQDGRLDAGDYLLFYAGGAHAWNYDAVAQTWRYEANIYADTSYCFLTFGGAPGDRIAQEPPAGQATQTTPETDFMLVYEQDQKNLIRSGRTWYGEEFDLTLQRMFPFALPATPVSPVAIRAYLAARCIGAPSTFTLSKEGASLGNLVLAAASPDYTSPYMILGTLSAQATVSGSNLNLSLQYSKPNSSAIGWLDRIEVVGRHPITAPSAGQVTWVQHAAGVAAGSVTAYRVAGLPADAQVWDVTRTDSIRSLQHTDDGSGARVFTATSHTLRRFAVLTGSAFPLPLAAGTVANQNLHATPPTDMVVVCPPEFRAQAEALADLHRQRDQMTVLVVTPGELYNEFSCGRQDLIAIRSFLRMLYHRAAGNPEEAPRHLLLFGSASYDYKNRVAGNTNWVPTYQSRNSDSPIGSYCSDAYVALLDEMEGAFAEGDRMDVTVGRLPARTAQQATEMVEKISRYLDPAARGDWQNRVMLVADDGDTNLHLTDMEEMAAIWDTTYPPAIVQKVYLDSYSRESRPGGNRYPEVNRDINARMNLGSLVVGYMGHGGVNGWAEERIITIPEIRDWSADGRLPLMVTATCEFTRFDNPGGFSAGEAVMLNPTGGAIALMTTTRITFTWGNRMLSTRLYRDELFRKGPDGVYPTLGEVFMRVSNADLGSVNTRNFTFLGDPALRLAYPRDEAGVTRINQVQVTPYGDTLKALALVRIDGEVVDAQSGQKRADYQGELVPSVFDKFTEVRTLGNSEDSRPTTYTEFRNLLYRGRANILNGDWTFSFVVPRDIAYQYGPGRINLYAKGPTGDAAGDYRLVMVGGTTDSVVPDDRGPQLRLYMNDRQFRDGGITDANPLFLADLFDSSGINTAGAGIGRDITLIRNGEVNSPIVLNQFYESALNDYTRGEIRYPFFRLDPGRYQLNLKVWDVHNNSSTGSISFVVTDDAGLVLTQLLNYPNPFSDLTTFQFNHNRPGQPLEAELDIYSVTGRLVKSIRRNIQSEGYFDNSITWDGRDDYGNLIANGVYVYVLRLRSALGETDIEAQKLVILR